MTTFYNKLYQEWAHTNKETHKNLKEETRQIIIKLCKISVIQIPQFDVFTNTYRCLITMHILCLYAANARCS